MNHRMIVKIGAMFALGSSAIAQAQSLAPILECQSDTALMTDIESLANRGRADGFDCRVHRRSHEEAAYCTGMGRARAFGHHIREFNLVRTPDGGAILSVAFAKKPSQIEPTIERARSEAAREQPLFDAVLEQREDGIAELRCVVAGNRGLNGSIAGVLDFRGVHPIPPMRVCAAPLMKTDRPYCIDTAEGQLTYAIDGLPQGEYYLTAFPLQRNPNRLFGVFGSSSQDCEVSPSACVRDRLQRVMVVPGDTKRNINPDTWVPELPAPLRRASGSPSR